MNMQNGLVIGNQYIIILNYGYTHIFYFITNIENFNQNFNSWPKLKGLHIHVLMQIYVYVYQY